jgi:hypothetical protein
MRTRLRLSALVFAVLLTAGCGGSSGPPVELVVPKGFIGTVWLLLDPDGQDIPLVDGRYRISVPADGILRVRSHQPMEQWHSFSARYDDGTPIPWDDSSNARVGPEVVAVQGSWAHLSRRGGREYRYHRYFVGTAKQRSEMLAMQDIDIPGVGK